MIDFISPMLNNDDDDDNNNNNNNNNNNVSPKLGNTGLMSGGG